MGPSHRVEKDEDRSRRAIGLVIPLEPILVVRVLLLSILVLAFFPIVTVSCAGEHVASASGFQLARGVEVPAQKEVRANRPTMRNSLTDKLIADIQRDIGIQTRMGQSAKSHVIEPYTTMRIFYALVVLALVVSFFLHFYFRVITAIVALLAAASLFGLKVQIDDEALRAAEFMLTVKPTLGFYFQLTVLLGSSIYFFRSAASQVKRRLSESKADTDLPITPSKAATEAQPATRDWKDYRPPSDRIGR